MDKRSLLEPIHIVNNHPTETLDVDPILECIKKVLTGENIRFSLLNIVLTDHKAHRALNKTYLDHDYDTDVIAFPLHEADDVLLEGEIYIDLDTARERHSEFNSSFAEEVRRYVVHGLLHLAGFEDKSESGRQVMKKKEEHYLSSYS